MNITITEFSNPFSFFCKLENDCNFNKDLCVTNRTNTNNKNSCKRDVSDLNHGQYVAVLWDNKWTRGVVTMESQFLIWLIDYGKYLRADDRTVYIELPAEYKKYPTKIFEASIHGVAPVDKVLTEDCQIRNEITNIWNKGTMEKATSLITSATSIYFVPVALLSTKYNDVVLGDVYIKTAKKEIFNIVEALELWPVFLQQNKEAYIENLATFYTSRRKHRACQLKPEFPDVELPTISLETTLDEYNTICKAMQLDLAVEYDANSDDGATAITTLCTNKDESAYKLTPAEIEKYSCMYITVCGREYNVLSVLLNKIRDLNICEQYKDHDLKSVGRANSRTPM